MTNSLVLITNSKNQNFGTGFVIYKERNYSYIVTCAHVIEGMSKSLLVDSVNAKVCYKGASDGLDLAVLKASIDKEPLVLMKSDCEAFEITGFKNFRNNDHILEPINSTLDTKIEFRPQSGEQIDGWKLHSDIPMGKDWMREINHELDACDYIARDDDKRCYQNLSEKYSLIRLPN